MGIKLLFSGLFNYSIFDLDVLDMIGLATSPLVFFDVL